MFEWRGCVDYDGILLMIQLKTCLNLWFSIFSFSVSEESVLQWRFNQVCVHKGSLGITDQILPIKEQLSK